MTGRHLAFAVAGAVGALLRALPPAIRGGLDRIDHRGQSRVAVVATGTAVSGVPTWWLARRRPIPGWWSAAR